MKPIRIVDDTYGDNYCHFGDGLNKGQCGIHVYRIDLNNSGRVQCMMGYKDQDQEVYAFIDLVVGLEPHIPKFEAFHNQ